ncbi:AAA family ATPase [Crateriforma spongiae]|uniref:AAA family ATPase n=1 Tax=Crateriforma spongiae TaxID=2724528 RepID=UPI0014487D74|nr:AAA family ATPase [Crateriforma spongiae]
MTQTAERNGQEAERIFGQSDRPETPQELLQREFNDARGAMIAAEARIKAAREQASMRGIELDTGERELFEPITAAELDAGDFTMTYLVDGVFVERQPLIIAGQFKTLKTSVMFDLAISLATATSFLGRFATQRRRVLVLTAESGLATVQETCRRICKQKERRLADVNGLSFCDRVPSLANPDHVQELRNVIADVGAEVLIADPAYLMIDGDNAGNLFSMGDQLRVFADLASESGATPVLLHHAKKNNLNATDYQPLELADLAWAGFAEFARQWLLLSRRERYVEGSGQHRLWLSAGGSAGHNGCWGIDVNEGHPSDDNGRRWGVNVTNAEESREAAAREAEERKEQAAVDREQKKIERNREKVIAAFRGVRPPRLTKSKISDRAGVSRDGVSRVIAYMLRAGELIDGVDVEDSRGRKHAGFELKIQPD